MSIGDQKATRFLAIIGLSLALCAGLGSGSAAADGPAPAAQAAPAPPPPGPITTKDPQISLDDLELLLAPLTKDELETEAKGWFDLLRAKEREITLAELSVHRKNREIALLEKEKAAAANLAKATAAAKATGGAGGAASEKVAEAQKALAKTVATASSETAKEEKKTGAAEGAMVKPADAAPAPASEAKANDVVAATRKEAATTEQVKALAAAAPAATGTAPAAVADASKKAETLVEKTEEATAAKTDAKVQLVDYSTQLTSERTALLDRLKLVLDKWELKGGDPKIYRLYTASIGGIKIDVSDRAATWARVSAWLTADEGGLRWARNLATFVAYILGSFVVARIVRRILRRALGSGRLHSSQLLADFLVSSSGRIVVAIGVLLALSALEINLAPLLAVIGAAGFVVAFALQGTLSNFASGILIMVFKPFDIGDEVDVGGGIKGKVASVNVFSTTILTDEGLQNIIPNDNIWKNVIVNLTTGVSKNPAGGEPKPAAG